MIPSVLHHCWMSGDRFIEPWSSFRRAWMHLHPSWTFYFWTMDNIFELPLTGTVRTLLKRDIHYVMKSDIVRYEVLRIFGGIYSDTDIRPLRNFSSFLDCKNFAGEGYPPNIISNGIIGCHANDPLIVRIGSVVCGILENGLSNPAISTFHLECDNVNSQSVLLMEIKTIYPAKLFYPYSHNDPELRHKRGREYPDSFAEHYWAGKDEGGWGEVLRKQKE